MIESSEGIGNLVLQRVPGETIRINDDISIKILAVYGQKVKIRIEAPKHVKVHREEIYQKIQQDKSNASI